MVGLSQGNGRGLDGRWAGRLVRGDRRLPPPLGHPDPPHRCHPAAQGPVRRHARRVRAAELPELRGDRRASARGPRRRAGGGVADRQRQRREDRRARRERLDEWAASSVEGREQDRALQDRGEERKRELLEHPGVRRWSASIWCGVKAAVREQADDPDSELRRRLADAVCAAGHRLQGDPALAQKTEELAESGARYLTEHFHDEIESLVSSTIERWDAEETARKLELLLGRDLQFIRINGTVVGGLAGLVIHAVSQAIG